jgi:hypothetical protein
MNALNSWSRLAAISLTSALLAAASADVEGEGAEASADVTDADDEVE